MSSKPYILRNFTISIGDQVVIDEASNPPESLALGKLNLDVMPACEFEFELSESSAATLKAWALRSTVFTNLQAAVDNGYFAPGEQLDGATVDEIAHDMLCYCADVEDLSIEDLRPHVEAWLALRKSARERVETALEPFIGKPCTPATLAEMKAAVAPILAELRKSEQ